MSVRIADDGTVLLEGVCAIEDAETLLRALSGGGAAQVDWGGCEKAHTAVIQVLMAAKPRMVGLPTDTFLRKHLAGLFGREA